MFNNKNKAYKTLTEKNTVQF